MGAAQFGFGENKKGTVEGSGEGKNGSIDEIYTPVSSRARGVLTVYLFFIKLIGYKGYKL
jgi:hypothetical protein